MASTGQGANIQTNKRKIENLARTGTEYPIMKMTTNFIKAHPQSEPLTEKPCPLVLVDEYIMNDAERANNNIGTVVFDSVDMSPFYDNSPNDLYLDEKLFIELPTNTQ